MWGTAAASIGLPLELDLLVGVFEKRRIFVELVTPAFIVRPSVELHTVIVQLGVDNLICFPISLFRFEEFDSPEMDEYVEVVFAV